MGVRGVLLTLAILDSPPFPRQGSTLALLSPHRRRSLDDSGNFGDDECGVGDQYGEGSRNIDGKRPRRGTSSSINMSLAFFCSLHTLPNSGLVRLRPHCQSSSPRTMHLQELDRENILETNKKKKKRKPRPGFLDVTMQKWSVKNPSQRVVLPWQESPSFYDDMKNFGLALECKDTELQADAEASHFLVVGNASVAVEPLPFKSSVSVSRIDDFVEKTDECEDIDGVAHSRSLHKMKENVNIEVAHNNLENFEDYADVKATRIVKGQGQKTVVEKIVKKMKEIGAEDRQRIPRKMLVLGENSAIGSVPWERSEGAMSRKKTKLAESVVPEPELQRLRNLALRMKERIKVQDGGVTQKIVDLIHERWENSEVVKIKFEGPPVHNMKRTHQILESKTGGVVIWRSGSSVVLYRGMAYELPCVQSYKKQSETKPFTNSRSNFDIAHNSDGPLECEVTNNDINSTGTNAVCPHPANPFVTSSLESTSERCIDSILDELGPRFKDWSGCHPFPVDADLLPSVLRDYKPPFRLLPHKAKHSIGNKDMTSLRRLARTVSPHFALGRNQQLQGLAAAMVRLWEKSVIAKIAIKRGVQNTCNENMAEEIKKLTGGTLVSRNKEYIVFYRGNDFLPPAVTEKLFEREKSSALQYEEEDKERLKASPSVVPKLSSAKGSCLAGTLAESLEAKSRWGREPTTEEKEEMMKDAALAKQASLIKYLERKLAYARRKVNKAERALAKIQEVLSPSELPNDQEIITDEERSMFRKIGLNMEAFLVLGRRGVFDGILENMHLHWKHRELVKIMVKGKSLPLVKHIAISLEAESGGLLISLDKTTKGYAIIIYRGKNYKRPSKIRPTNLLTRRKALTHSIELQRREALNHHIFDLRERIKRLRSELGQMKAGKEKEAEELYAKFDEEIPSEDYSEDEDEEVYPWTVGSTLDEEKVT